jgi:hypothetical protein
MTTNPQPFSTVVEAVEALEVAAADYWAFPLAVPDEHPARLALQAARRALRASRDDVLWHFKQLFRETGEYDAPDVMTRITSSIDALIAWSKPRPVGCWVRGHDLQEVVKCAQIVRAAVAVSHLNAA